MTGSNNAGEVQPGKDRPTDGEDGTNGGKASKRHLVDAQASVRSASLKFIFDQQKRARVHAGLVQPCRHVSQQATVPCGRQVSC